MFIFSIRTVVLTVALSASSLSSAATLSEQSELLCSPEGLMHLIPQFNVKGQFTIPNPNTDLQTFLSAQQGLLNAIDMILAQENISQNPSNVGSLPSRPLTFASNWLSSEVGIQTDGTVVGSILKVRTAPVGMPWMWTLAFGHLRGCRLRVAVAIGCAGDRFNLSPGMPDLPGCREFQGPSDENVGIGSSPSARPRAAANRIFASGEACCRVPCDSHVPEQGDLS